MKCPYCNKEMWHPIGKPTWSCQNWDCMESEGMIGNHVLWQALIDTKKKLDIVVSALKKLSLGNIPSLPDDETLALAMCNYARDTLEQINGKEKPCTKCSET